ncbi:MAG: T9SS type A sorting domain-containing protein [Candidatus Aenigmatarchaeota archaeon]
MRKLIIFLLLISFSIFGRKYYVPEEFCTIQEAIIFAKDRDTISVAYWKLMERGQGIMNKEITLEIMKKEITFEIRYGGEKELLEMLKSLNRSAEKVDNDNTLERVSPWTAPQIVNKLDTLSDIIPHIGIDNFNSPWVVWKADGVISGWSFCYTKWNGRGWEEEKGLIRYDSIARESRTKPRITFDNQNVPWVIYSKKFPNNTDDIFFTRKIGEEWEPERQVNLPDSFELDFAPKIAYGGGQLWCCWYGGISDTHPYHIYVSRWNNTFWEPEIDISVPVGPNHYGRHWFCDIAVDRYGHPHVVWGEGYITGRVYYRTYDGQQWLPPVIINDPNSRCAPWSATAIAIDDKDNIHVVWAGFVSGRHDIYYSKFDRELNRWLSPIRINYPDPWDVRYPDIVVANSINIWAAYERLYGNDCAVFATHFDGERWSEEIRIDDWSISYWNGCAELAWDGENFWCVWRGLTTGIGKSDVYYSRCPSLSLEEISLRNNFLLISPNPFKEKVLFSYHKNVSGKAVLAIYDLSGKLIKVLINNYQEKGKYNIFWNGKDMKNKEISEGIYFVVLKLEGVVISKKLIKSRR